MPLCRCASEPLPHRRGEGECLHPEFICQHCREGCEVIYEDVRSISGSFDAPISECCHDEVLLYDGTSISYAQIERRLARLEELYDR